jgi:hypothetical protein
MTQIRDLYLGIPTPELSAEAVETIVDLLSRIALRDRQRRDPGLVR